MANLHVRPSATASASSATTVTADGHVHKAYRPRQGPAPARSFLAIKLKQYEYTFGLYMMEPWEKACFNTVILLFAFFIVYAVYWYLPSTAYNLVAKATYYLSATSTNASPSTGRAFR
ncbi:uncharacterized protein EV422DRAFT_565563 [Fimicolochytrium jonesii]|uniref:uncharacterized protein n=1 Tax=Fimicolochytrium jonesii TaxID=1396493 RepID=UPI0022FE38F6|nr:uncharacterized protein EV422DRAFT_565563 [Fimicolochytrium jonesii]KAI8823626.1 hypothetical protein EV422DRAFT_565563 [Fimicolochytrium jonesii]